MAETPGSDTGSRIRAAANGALDYIMRLELTPARWERIAGIIDIAIEAAVAGDLDGLSEAVEELELVGPVRVVRIGGTPAAPPPSPVRERDVLLRHALREEKQADEGDKNADSR
jgi:hypothetical protein